MHVQLREWPALLKTHNQKHGIALVAVRKARQACFLMQIHFMPNESVHKYIYLPTFKGFTIK